MDEVDDVNPNDISYVYSGYAPLSVRLVQCVSMKPAVLATSVTSHNNNNTAAATPAVERDDAAESVVPDTLPRAHAIVGWKGFEETVRAVPGATFDELQKAEHGGASTHCESLLRVPLFPQGLITFCGNVSFHERWRYDDGLLPRRMHVYRDSGPKMDE